MSVELMACDGSGQSNEVLELLAKIAEEMEDVVDVKKAEAQIQDNGSGDKERGNNSSCISGNKLKMASSINNTTEVPSFDVNSELIFEELDKILDNGKVDNGIAENGSDQDKESDKLSGGKKIDADKIQSGVVIKSIDQNVDDPMDNSLEIHDSVDSGSIKNGSAIKFNPCMTLLKVGDDDGQSEENSSESSDEMDDDDDHSERADEETVKEDEAINISNSSDEHSAEEMEVVIPSGDDDDDDNEVVKNEEVRVVKSEENEPVKIEMNEGIKNDTIEENEPNKGVDNERVKIEVKDEVKKEKTDGVENDEVKIEANGEVKTEIVKNEVKESVKNEVISTSVASVSEDKVNQSGECSSTKVNTTAAAMDSLTTGIKRKSDLERPVVKKASPPVLYRPVADIVLNIGLDIVRERVYKDLIKVVKKRDDEGSVNDSEREKLEKMKVMRQNLVKKNMPYEITLQRCRCHFRTFSKVAMEFHRGFGHGLQQGIHSCCYCSGFHTKSSSEFQAHMQEEHQIRATFHFPVLHMCQFCPYMVKDTSRLKSHSQGCRARFVLDKNLFIQLHLFDIQIFQKQEQKTLRPILPAAGNQNAKIDPRNLLAQLERARVAPQQNFRNASILPRQDQIPLRPQIKSPADNSRFRIAPAIGNPRFGINSLADTGSLRLASPQYSSDQFSQQQIQDIARAAVAQAQLQMAMKKPTATRQPFPIRPANSTRPSAPAATNVRPNMRSVLSSRPNVAIRTPANFLSGQRPIRPNLAMRTPRPENANVPSCEICGGLVQNLENLRSHMLRVHKIEIKSIDFFTKGKTQVCKTCFQGFWTKAGLDRHGQTAHGLKMQAGVYTCIRCGATPVPNILNHLSTQHNVTLLDMHHACYCGVCNRKFKANHLFGQHMVQCHPDIFPNNTVLITMINALSAASLFKNMGASNSTPTKQAEEKILFHLAEGRMPPAGFGAGRVEKQQAKCKLLCESCSIQFSNTFDMERHFKTAHTVRCSRCNELWGSVAIMQRHFMVKHHTEKDPCVICGEMVQIGRPTVRHLKRMHVRECSVIVRRLRPKETMRYLQKLQKMTFPPRDVNAVPTSDSGIKARRRLSSAVCTQAKLEPEQTDTDVQTTPKDPAVLQDSAPDVTIVLE